MIKKSFVILTPNFTIHPLTLILNLICEKVLNLYVVLPLALKVIAG